MLYKTLQRCRIKEFLTGALVALLFGAQEWNHLCNFERGHHGEHMKFGPVVQGMLFTDDGPTDDGQRPITRAHLEPSAQVS